MKLRNYSFIEIIYKIWDKKFKKELPFFIVKIFTLKKSREDSKCLKINTYDGSGQSVHPDVIKYKNNLYLCVTPYPYGIDTYENPSLYDMETKENEFPNPIIRTNNYKTHLSDPCLFIKNDKLAICYRETEKKNSKNSKLFYMESEDGKIWSTPEVILENTNCDLISPAILYGVCYWLFYVNLNENANSLECRMWSNDVVSEKLYRVKLIGFKTEEIWHIGISNLEGEDLKSIGRQAYCVITTINTKQKYQLFIGKLLYENGWLLLKLNEVKDDFIFSCESVYKSCLMKENDKIIVLISIFTKQHKWKIYKKQLDMKEIHEKEKQMIKFFEF